MLMFDTGLTICNQNDNTLTFQLQNELTKILVFQAVSTRVLPYTGNLASFIIDLR